MKIKESNRIKNRKGMDKMDKQGEIKQKIR